MNLLFLFQCSLLYSLLLLYVFILSAKRISLNLEAALENSVVVYSAGIALSHKVRTKQSCNVFTSLYVFNIIYILYTMIYCNASGAPCIWLYEGVGW